MLDEERVDAAAVGLAVIADGTAGPVEGGNGRGPLVPRGGAKEVLVAQVLQGGPERPPVEARPFAREREGLPHDEPVVGHHAVDAAGQVRAWRALGDAGLRADGAGMRLVTPDLSGEGRAERVFERGHAQALGPAEEETEGLLEPFALVGEDRVLADERRRRSEKGVGGGGGVHGRGLLRAVCQACGSAGFLGAGEETCPAGHRGVGGGTRVRLTRRITCGKHGG